MGVLRNGYDKALERIKEALRYDEQMRPDITSFIELYHFNDLNLSNTTPDGYLQSVGGFCARLVFIFILYSKSLPFRPFAFGYFLYILFVYPLLGVAALTTDISVYVDC